MKHGTKKNLRNIFQIEKDLMDCLSDCFSLSALAPSNEIFNDDEASEKDSLAVHYY